MAKIIQRQSYVALEDVARAISLEGVVAKLLQNRPRGNKIAASETLCSL